MTKTKSTAFTIARWDETENKDWNGGKLTRTLATKEFKGEIDGTSVLEAVMLKAEGNQGVMAYVGLERISCTLEGRTGTFVLIHNAEAIGIERNATWKILPGSGTDGLTGISGYGEIAPNHEFKLIYELPSDDE
jgi:hypothetical protein